MKPAVIEPSHMPRIKRTVKRPPKFLHAACEHKAIAHTVMLMLHDKYSQHQTNTVSIRNVPHPFSHGETLKGKVLRVLKHQVAQIEDGTKPIIPGVRVNDDDRLLDESIRTGLWIDVSLPYR